MNDLIFVAIGVSLCAIVSFGAFRANRRLEAVGWLAFGAMASSVFVVDFLHGPNWLVNTFCGVALALSIPLMWISLRRQWRRK
jgi:hypothetical protein